jgi:hypothetical protein
MGSVCNILLYVSSLQLHETALDSHEM